MRSKWDWEVAWEILPAMAEGMWVTIKATLVGIVIAVTLGLFMALGRRSQKKWLSMPVAGIIEFIRSTPILIQLFFIYYALPNLTFLPDWARVIRPLTALILGLGIHYATYASEAYRAGINSVPKGQWEAATAMNLGTYHTWRHVVLPQAIPRTLPALGNYFVAMFKDAPIGSSISVVGVLFVARSIQSQTFRSVEPMMVAGAMFLAVSIPAAMFVRYLERRLGYET